LLSNSTCADTSWFAKEIAHWPRWDGSVSVTWTPPPSEAGPGAPFGGRGLSPVRGGGVGGAVVGAAVGAGAAGAAAGAGAARAAPEGAAAVGAPPVGQPWWAARQGDDLPGLVDSGDEADDGDGAMEGGMAAAAVAAAVAAGGAIAGVGVGRVAAGAAALDARVRRTHGTV